MLIGASAIFGGRTGARVLQILAEVVLARGLGAVSFGIFTVGRVTLKFLEFIAAGGFDKGVIRFGSRELERDPGRFKGILIQTALAAGVVGLFLGLGLALASDPLGIHGFEHPRVPGVLRAVAIGVPFLALSKLTGAATRVTGKMKFGVLIEDLVPSSAFFLGAVGTWLLGWGVGGAVGALVCSVVFGAATGALVTRDVFRDVWARPASFAPLRALFGFATPVALASVTTVVIFWADRLLLGLFRPMSEVGVYQAVAQVAFAPTLILSGLGVSLAPRIAFHASEGPKSKLAELFRMSTRWSLYGGLPLLVVIFLSPERVIATIFGSAYLSGTATIVILGIGVLFNVAAGSVGVLLVMAGYEAAWLRLSLAVAFLTLVLYLVLIPRLGLEGAALGSMSGLVMLNVSALMVAYRKLGLWPYSRRYWKLVVALIVNLGVISVVDRLAPGESLGMLLVELLVSYGAFAAALVMVGLDPDDREFLEMAASPFRRAG